jgi:hypothetical protein
MESEVTAVTSQTHALQRHTQAKSRRWLPLGALVLALVPSCNSLWHSYLEPCDPESPTCLSVDAAVPDLVPPIQTPQLVPSNGIDPAWFAEASTELVPTEDLVIDTEQGTVVTKSGKTPLPNVVHHTVAPVDCGASWPVGIGVFAFTRIHIPDGITVRFTGSHAAALIASGSITIEGLLDLRGGECTDPRCGGPGGFAGGYVRNPIRRGEGPGSGTEGYGIGGVGDEAGGGGAGACGKGGKGGDAGVAMYPGGAGGSEYMKEALVPLCGGSGGGAGGFGTTMGESGQRGGGGGGAIQIVSQQSVTVGSTSASPSGIHVGGGGGQGDTGTNFNDGGGGGGSGGAILIEAPTVSILSGAVLAANGGGGGGGYNNMMPTNGGESGKLASSAAAGGAGLRESGGAGGAGQASHGSDASGLPMDGGGGGGGGVGRIRLNSLDGNVTISGELSPAIGSCASTGRVTMR